MKAQSMAKIQIHSKKQSNLKYVYVFMVMMRKTVNKKLKYLMREGFDNIQLKFMNWNKWSNKLECFNIKFNMFVRQN